MKQPLWKPANGGANFELRPSKAGKGVLGRMDKHRGAVESWHGVKVVLMFVMLALGRLRQENQCQFKVSLCSVARLFSRKN